MVVDGEAMEGMEGKGRDGTVAKAKVAMEGKEARGKSTTRPLEVVETSMSSGAQRSEGCRTRKEHDPTSVNLMRLRLSGDRGVVSMLAGKTLP